MSERKELEQQLSSEPERETISEAVSRAAASAEAPGSLKEISAEGPEIGSDIPEQAAERKDGTPEEVPEKKDETPAPKGGEALSRKRRTALVAYLSVLFAVAFLLVALSLIIENRQLQSTSEKTSANLNGRIAEMQREFDRLKAKSDDQQRQIGELTAAGEEKDAALEELRVQLEEAAAREESMQAQMDALQEDLEAQSLKAAEVQLAHELLYAAQLADEEGDMERLQELLTELEPLQDLLCPTAREILDELAIA